MNKPIRIDGATVTLLDPLNPYATVTVNPDFSVTYVLVGVYKPALGPRLDGMVGELIGYVQKRHASNPALTPESILADFALGQAQSKKFPKRR